MNKDDNKKTHIIVTGKGGGGSGYTDWDDITNKPDFATVATSGSYTDLNNKPTILTQWFGTQAEYDAIVEKDPNVIYNIEGGQPVQSNWNENDSTSLAYIQNRPTIPAMTIQELTFTLEGGVKKTIEFYTAPNYFYVQDISGADNTLSIKKEMSSAPTIEVFCSTDRSNWTSMGTTSTTAITATIPANGKLYLKATANQWGTESQKSNNIKVSGNHNVGGNIMSLLYGDNFEGQTTLPSGVYTFHHLFDRNSALVNAQDLILPATTIGDNAYNGMFNGCTSLTTAPALPATTMAWGCYTGMFRDCTSLTTAPELPATTLERVCYEGMFRNCTSLTTAPALPATDLTGVNDCYANMFDGCTALTTAPALPATTLSAGCYNSMFNGCTSLTTAPVLPAMNVQGWCYNSMFKGCTSLTTAPALPATTLVDYCYNSMFRGCTSLTTAPALPATTLTSRCYTDMFNGCTSLTSATIYANDISANNCLDNWLNNVAAQGEFYNLGGATFESGASGIPTGWTEHTSL